MVKRKNGLEEVGCLIHKIVKSLHSRGRTSLKKEGLTYPEYHTLNFLSDGNQHKMSTLKEELLITGSGATAVVNKLIKKSLAKREYSQVDRRIVNVIIAEKGEELLKSINAKRKQFLSYMFSLMNNSERKTVAQALKALLSVLEKIDRKGK